MRILSSALWGAAVALLLVLDGVVGAAQPATDYEVAFAEWMRTYHVAFDDAVEYAKRLEIFVLNDLFITTHNARAGTNFTLGHNAFSHLTFDEFAAPRRGLIVPRERLSASRASTSIHRRPIQVSPEDIPESIDWVAKGGVTEVKNQGQCGSCWAFSTTGAVEGAAFAASGKLLSLSEQQLVDCDHNKARGCNGGFMDHAFEWIRKTGGICLEEEYQYHAAVEKCHKCKRVVAVTAYHEVDPNNEEALRQAVAMQPVAVAIEADQREFQFYQSGVFDATCGSSIDHGVLAVGYGEDDGKKYWKIKNSWGATWGEKGFIRLARNIGPPAGQCGVASLPSYAVASIKDDVEDDISGPQVALAQEQAEILAMEAELLANPVRDESTLEREASLFGRDGNVFEYFPEGN